MGGNFEKHVKGTRSEKNISFISSLYKLKQFELDFFFQTRLNSVFYTKYLYFSPNVVHRNCVIRAFFVLSITGFITLYLYKCSFMVTLKVPVHIYRLFSIRIGYTENMFSIIIR